MFTTLQQIIMAIINRRRPALAFAPVKIRK